VIEAHPELQEILFRAVQLRGLQQDAERVAETQGPTEGLPLDQRSTKVIPPSTTDGRFESFMSKKSSKGKGWQQRYFVFSDGVLTYYKHKTTQAMFAELDQQNNGYLDITAIEQLCGQMGRSLKAADLESARADMDADNNGMVDFAEFDAWWQVNGGKALKRSRPQGAIDVRICDGLRSSTTSQGETIIILHVPNKKREMELKPDAAVADTWINLLKAAVASGTAARKEIGFMTLVLPKRETGFGMRLSDTCTIEDPGPLAASQGVPVGGRIVSLNGTPVASLKGDEDGLLAVLRDLTVGQTCTFSIKYPA
jgi:hypothetical protein